MRFAGRQRVRTSLWLAIRNLKGRKLYSCARKVACKTSRRVMAQDSSGGCAFQFPGAAAGGARAELIRTWRGSNMLQRLEARMPVLADNEMVVHRDTEGARDLHNRLRHLDVGARGGRIARGMVVHNHNGLNYQPDVVRFFDSRKTTGAAHGGW